MRLYKNRIRRKLRLREQASSFNPLTDLVNRSESLLEQSATTPTTLTASTAATTRVSDEQHKTSTRRNGTQLPQSVSRTTSGDYQLAEDFSPDKKQNNNNNTKVFDGYSNMASQANHPGPAGPPAANGAGAPVPDSYFTETKKGEVNELRNLLRNFTTEKNPQRKRDIIKKVIAYMTLGIDVSRLFTEMMLAIETRDLVIKKMVYLFLCNYATSHPDLAQMCTNTLVKDCGNDDPMVRGLALRALCSLRLPQMVEYISEPLRRSLTDGHAYVRKTGVMGVLKLYDLDKEAFERGNFVDVLYDMLRDADASVVSNCIIVLNEIMVSGPNGGMAINRAIMLHLLNRIHEFSEFGVVQVLELIPRYIPANEEEGFQIMNLLDPVLRTSNSGAVMATIRAFLALADNGNDVEAMQRQVVGRIKAPLITLVASGSPELVYCLLKHVESLIDLCPAIFDDEYRQFYVRYHEPTNIKYLKINILPKLTNPDNAPDIVAELAENVADVDVTMSRLAVRSMTRIACRDVGGPGCAESIARRLVEMLDLNVTHICSEAATALTAVIRKHPSLKSFIAPPLPRALRYVTEPSGKASIVYLLGECGDVVREAPYALEKLIDSYDEIADPNVKIALLTSTMKLFFLRPPEVQRMLGRLLGKATEDVSSQDLHDRALMYYRLLRSSSGNPKVVESVVQTNVVIPETINFSEEDDGELRAALMEEFNTLSIMYGKPSETFIREEFQVKYVKMPEDHPLEPSGAGAGAAAPIPPANDIYAEEPRTVAVVPEDSGAVAPPPAASDHVVDLLGFGDSAPAPAPATPASPVGLSLVPAFSMSGEDYESKWGAIAEPDAMVTTVPMSCLPASTDNVEASLMDKHIMTMASGELDTEFKFFLYAQDSVSGTVFLIQSNISKASPEEPLMILTIKASGGENPSASKQKVEMLMEVLNAALG
mmetsp:Transcript_5567/g.8526  ORF Transcript_5567/g.8526 Transcript_5567/m.8526 type:complete len:939 (+) Transcript_5567:53-2869(+)